MMRPPKSITMARKKLKQDKDAEKEFFIEGKQEITNPDAPVISNEFVDLTREEGVYHGQDIEVHSETKLEADTGYGQEIVIRTYEFAMNPKYAGQNVPAQEIFNSHLRGIESLLWQDGMKPYLGIEPRLIFSKDRSKYLIIVGAEAARGQWFNEQPKTLTELINESRTDKDEVQRGVPISSNKKEKASRATKAPK